MKQIFFKESRIIIRLLQPIHSDEFNSSKQISNVIESTINQSENILLFVRLEGQNYCSLGRLSYVAYDLDSSPVKIKWKLLDYDKLVTCSYFQNILKAK